MKGSVEAGVRAVPPLSLQQSHNHVTAQQQLSDLTEREGECTRKREGERNRKGVNGHCVLLRLQVSRPESRDSIRAHMSSGPMVTLETLAERRGGYSRSQGSCPCHTLAPRPSSWCILVQQQSASILKISPLLGDILPLSFFTYIFICLNV